MLAVFIHVEYAKGVPQSTPDPETSSRVSHRTRRQVTNPWCTPHTEREEGSAWWLAWYGACWQALDDMSMLAAPEGAKSERRSGSRCGVEGAAALPAPRSRVQTVSDLDSSFQNGILRSTMGAAAARSGAPCVPTATPGPWDIPQASGVVDSSIAPFIIK